MTAFALEIEYLTGYAVATDPTNRDRPEWPPHPARVFMALAAAHFETHGSDEEKQAERAALEWLAALPPPAMSVPDASPRETCTVYVPVNDAEGIGVLPTSRSRQPRTFPRVYVGDQPLRLVWAGDEASSRHLPALDRVSRAVARIGHSSSLVSARIERDVTSIPLTHKTEQQGTSSKLRVTTAGEVQRLEDAANLAVVTDYSQLSDQAQSAKGKVKKELKARLLERFPRGEPISRRPTVSLGVSYAPVERPEPGVPKSLFDPNFIILSAAEGNEQRFGLESTLQLVAALRGAIMKKSGEQPVPNWVCGHNPDGSKLEGGRHMALIPLPFVGHKHADGHIMGMGIVIPRDVPRRERARVLGPMLFDETTNEPSVIELTMGHAGTFKVVRDTSIVPPWTLRTDTWTRPSHGWRSVTPIVLDRMPKTDRKKHPAAWREEVARIICAACVNIGLPEPATVRVEKTPLLRGSLRAMPSQGGFAVMKPGTFQVHAEATFDERVRGPVLLGAGRFRGYGLCRPIQEGEAR